MPRCKQDKQSKQTSKQIYIYDARANTIIGVSYLDYGLREDKPRSESLCASIRQSNKRHFDSFLPLALATAWAVKVMEIPAMQPIS